ncbi:MAG: Cytosol non-specific dipeptidase [Promethearchaeota archaeon]|nr:MAG: Cytosol non-specific dipeptidase [Candidatus Lokiarchaeota archaeon]
MNDLEELSKPEHFWKYFQAISEIPRCSGNEEHIRAFIKEQCERLGYHTQIDDVGNLIAFPNLDDQKINKIVILQSHMDMVCEKNKAISHNFQKDPLNLEIIEYRGEKWLTAKGTTLGADNGVGIAFSLALLEALFNNDLTIQKPIIKVLFTVEEEKGLTGAFNIDPTFLRGDYLLNLDSEEDDTFTIGCAGGINTTGLIRLSYQKINEDSRRLRPIRLAISGLKGGHSGVDINKGRANAIKIISKILWKGNDQYHIYLTSLTGGNLPNAIPREAEALFYVEENSVDNVFSLLEQTKTEIELGISKVEPNMNIEFSEVEDMQKQKIFSQKITDKLLHLLYVMPNGPISYHSKNRDLVYTSTNLASIRMDSDILTIITSQRSLHEISKTIIQEKIIALFELADLDLEITHKGGYPGWQPNFDSELLKIAKNSYLNLFKEEPNVQTIHAGLETGIMKEKAPNLEMISLGPTVLGGHSPDEKLRINSVAKIWSLLIDLVQNIR